MRVMIHFQDSSNRDAFEGVRLRKTLKGECERMGVSWVDSKFANPDIAHFISSKDISVLQRFSKNGSKTVVSALYCEHEVDDSFLELDRFGRISLKNSGKKMLNEADLVLVPSISAKKLLVSNGVTSEIKVAQTSVNVERFEVDELEKQLFLRYFGVSPERKYVLITGNFHEKRKMSLVRGLSKAFPRLRFYFFGCSTGTDAPFINHYKFLAGDNLKISRILSDDVYRSAVIHASAYLVLSPLPDGIGITEAFAAKTPVIAFGDQTLNPNLIDGVTALVCPTEKELVQTLSELDQGREINTTISAFAIASRNNLNRGGQTLKANYEKLLEGKKEGNEND